jgi:ceramide glucosyltransferase
VLFCKKGEKKPVAKSNPEKSRWLNAPVFCLLCAVQFLKLIFAAFAALSAVLGLWQWLAARKFPLHRKIAVDNFAPAVSILKPLKGCDATTAASLASWFTQTYAGPVEIIFGVAEAGDPVCEIVRRLIAENSGVRAQLVICEHLAGANAKAAKLAQLEKRAAHDLIVISDADVRVPPDFLASFVAPLRDENTALVNCFYRLANPTTTAMRWEAVAVNADFWSQVLQAQTLKPLDFALGAAILVRRQSLAAIGGFAALANCLADDYQLGHRLAAHGRRIALCPVVVECWDAPQNWTRIWKHQLRWARTVRVCQPLPYFFSLLANATVWPLLWLAAAVGTQDFFCVALISGGFLLLRLFLAQNLQRRFSPGRKIISPVWLVPVKDLLAVALWLGAFLGDTIEWRGRKMKLRRDGTLAEIKAN